MAQKAMSAEQPELPIKIDQAVVKQLRSWRAHSDSIRSVKVYSQPAFAVTAGYDQMVKIWTLQGEMMTVLRAYGQIPWQFPVRADMVGIDEQTLNGILEQVKRVEVEDDKKSLMKSRYTKPVVHLSDEVKRQQQKAADMIATGSAPRHR